MFLNIFDKVSTESLNKDKGVINLIEGDNEIKDLEKHLDLFSLEKLKVKIRYEKINKVDLKTFYKLHVRGYQKCVVTLRPVIFTIKEEFKMDFIDSSKVDIKSLNDEYIEPIINHQINFGNIAIQMLSLYLDPYPRSKNKNYILDGINNLDKRNLLINNNAFEELNKIKK